MSSAALCIVGLGARTPAGLRALPAAIAVHAGISCVGEHPYIHDQVGDPFMVGMDRTIDAHERRERMFELAASALGEALEALPFPRVELPVYLGLPPESSFPRAEANVLCTRLAHVVAELGHRTSVTPICDGNAAGVMGLESLLAAVGSGTHEIGIVGGVDSFMDPDVLEQLDERGRVASRTNRWGFQPGEGAGMLVTCSERFARQHRLPVLAKVIAVVTTIEPKHMFSEAICIGEGLGGCLKQAVSEAGAPIGRQFCDIDGERYREHEFSFAIQRLHPSAFDDALDYVSPTSSWGNCGAATAPLLTVLAVGTNQRGFGCGRRQMVWCCSENGRRGAIVLDFDKERRR